MQLLGGNSFSLETEFSVLIISPLSGGLKSFTIYSRVTDLTPEQSYVINFTEYFLL